jgi:hypothetical protein
MVKALKIVYEWFMNLIAKTTWRTLRTKVYGRGYNLSTEDWRRIHAVLTQGYYIILTADKSHASSWAVRFAGLGLTGKISDYSHALVNIEPDQDSYAYSEFRFIEALGSGVKVSNWDEVFNCDTICILKPKYYSTEELNHVLAAAYTLVGRKYDKYFNLKDAKELSCVEVVRNQLKQLPYYEDRMRVFEFMIQHYKNLTPQMFRDCPDFEVLLELKR